MRSPAYVLRHSPGPAVGVAAFTVMALVMTGLVAGTLIRGAGANARSYTAVLTDANGLGKGDDVRMAGVRVGRVEERELHDGLAHVRFTVEGAQTVYADSRAEVNFLNLLGRRYLEITKGSGRAPLPAGAIIPVSRTSPGLDLTALFNAFEPLFDLLRPRDVNRLATQISATLQGQGPTLRDLAEQTARLTGHLAGREQVIGRVIENLSTVMDSASKHRDDIGVLIGELSSLTHGLAQDRTEIGSALGSLADLSVAMDDLTRRARRPLTDDLGRLHTLTLLIDKQRDVLGRGVTGLPKLLDAYARTMSYGSWLNVYICSLSYRTPDGRDLDGRRAGGSSKACR